MQYGFGLTLGGIKLCGLTIGSLAMGAAIGMSGGCSGNSDQPKGDSAAPAPIVNHTDATSTESPTADSPSAASRTPESMRGETGATRAPNLPSGAPRKTLLPAGELAPEFTALDQAGKPVRLSELLRDQQVVLVFYPADFTPGCTKQLCAVRDDWEQFRKRNAVVLGVNPADIAKHASFVEKYQFPFQLIEDKDSVIAAAYGCKGLAYTQRTVYVIGRDGAIKLSESGMVPHDRIFAALD